MVMKSTLVLAGLGAAALVVAAEREVCEGQAPREDRETERGRYTLSGAAVTFAAGQEDAADDADDARASGASAGDLDVDEPASGTVDGATLTVRLREGQTVVFRR